jgi:hypothetical protein
VTPARNPRGRPRAFSKEGEAQIRNLFPEIKTTRGLQNRLYAMGALNALKAHAGAAMYERFTWLLGPSFERAKFRFTVLTELGRLDNPADVVTFAETLCRKPLPPRTAVALLRQRVRGKGAANPTLEATVGYLAGAVGAWFRDHPDAEEDVMLEALNEVYRRIEEGSVP